MREFIINYLMEKQNLQELSKETLNSYYKKANKDIDEKSKKLSKKTMEPDGYKKGLKKINNRRFNSLLAIRKINKKGSETD